MVNILFASHDSAFARSEGLLAMRFMSVQFWLADVSMRRFAGSIVKPYRAAMVLLLLSGLFSTLAESAGIGVIVLLVNLVVDPQHAFSAPGGGDFARIYGFLAAVPVCGLVTALLVFLLGRSLAMMVYMQQGSSFRHGVSEELRNAIYLRCFEMPYQDAAKMGSGELASLVSADSWSLADACITLIQLVVSLGSACILVGIMFFVAWQLAVAAILLTLFLLIVVHFVWMPANAAGEAVTQANADLYGEMMSGLQSMRTIKTHAIEHVAVGWFSAASRNARQAFVEIDYLYSWIRPVGEVSGLVLLISVAAVANLLGVAPAGAVAALLLLYRIQPRIREAENAVLMLAGHGGSLAKVKELVDQSGDTASDISTDRIEFERLRHCIEFKDVSFAYGEDADQSVLKRFSATIQAGQVVAIIGPSGVGKTTLIALLLRLLDAQSGEILVDGISIRVMDKHHWLSRIGSAGQDLALLSGTIAQNISLRDPRISMDMVRAAARDACLTEYVNMLPNGYDTIVGQGGINFSGGQRQRLALARVFARNPDIVILDEATSALDRPLADKIMQTVLSRFAGRTVILISHDAAVTSLANNIIMLQQAE